MKKLDFNELTTEQKLGQLLVARNIKTDEDKAFFFEMLEKKAIGGIQIRYEKGCEEFINEILRRAEYPILICADMEHGYPGSDLKVPSQISVSSTGKEEIAYELARAVAIEAKNAGFNVVWGPVVDFASEKALCTTPRCFSDELEEISKYACAMIKGYQDEGMIATAKHFPCGSDTFDDTHIKASASKLTKEELLKKDIAPYVEAIKKTDVAAIMTNHKLFEKIDSEHIATLSEKVIRITREIGFEGLLFTDSLAMMSIVNTYGIKNSMGLAIKAGHDMLLYNQSIKLKEAYKYICETYNEGFFDDERLDDAVKHVIVAQEKTLKKPSSQRLTGEQTEIVAGISKLSLCAKVKNGAEIKLSENTKKGFILLCENTYDFLDNTYELQVTDQYLRENVERKKVEIENQFPGSQVMVMSEFPHKKEMQEACKLLAATDETVFFTFNITTNHLGNDDINDRIKYLIKSYEDKISTVIHIGNPYVLKNFENIKCVMWGTVGGECEKWAIKALKGEFIPEGKIPVKL